nr:MAG TPA: hypothetical protein [Caudoviricetes sp.]
MKQIDNFLIHSDHLLPGDVSHGNEVSRAYK